jgi:hypothetical protein
VRHVLPPERTVSADRVNASRPPGTTTKKIVGKVSRSLLPEKHTDVQTLMALRGRSHLRHTQLRALVAVDPKVNIASTLLRSGCPSRCQGKPIPSRCAGQHFFQAPRMSELKVASETTFPQAELEVDGPQRRSMGP